MRAAALLLIAGLCACSAVSRDEERQNRIARLHNIALEYYRLWARGKPPSCQSPILERAREAVLNTADAITPEAQGFDATVQAGSWVLDVADGAKAHGCREFAHGLYERVASTYAGTAYAGLHDRALAGIADTTAATR